MAPASGSSRSSACTSCSLPSETWMKLGILPRRSKRVCIFTAALVGRKWAQGTTGDRGPWLSCIDGVGEIQPEILAGIELPGLDDQSLGELGMDAPVAPFVGIGQRRAPHRVAGSPV